MLTGRGAWRQGPTAEEPTIAVHPPIDYSLAMGDGTDWFRIVMLLGALAVCAPWAIRVLRTDRRVPHYIALWLAIGLALGLLYEAFGPF